MFDLVEEVVTFCIGLTTKYLQTATLKLCKLNKKILVAFAVKTLSRLLPDGTNGRNNWEQIKNTAWKSLPGLLALLSKYPINKTSFKPAVTCIIYCNSSGQQSGYWYLPMRSMDANWGFQKNVFMREIGSGEGGNGNRIVRKKQQKTNNFKRTSLLGKHNLLR